MIKNLLKLLDAFIAQFIKKQTPLPVIPEPVYSEEEIDLEIEEVVVKSNRERLYDIAKACLIPARDVSPADVANDEVGCVESFDNIHKLTFGTFINGTKSVVSVSTIKAYEILSRSRDWQKVTDPLPGDVILCVTGKGNGRVSNGHIGICGKTHIMSNSSFTGNWEANFTYASWKKYYELKGGFKSHYFRRK